jgi:asparagine synthetase A
MATTSFLLSLLKTKIVIMDRLTQLQDCSLKLYEIFFTAIGALQRDAPLMELNPDVPVTCWTKEQIKGNWEGNVELSKSAAKDIIETVKVIDLLIDSLPGITEAEEEQVPFTDTRWKL